MFKRLIEKLYLKNMDSQIYFDNSGARSQFYYDEVVVKKYCDKEVFVAFLDINNLKKINDERGHNEGTKVIQQVVTQLSRLGLLEVCRVGGDEFVVIGNSDFEPQKLNYVDDISYGYVVKKTSETIPEVVELADKYMYKRKKKIHDKKRKKR